MNHAKILWYLFLGCVVTASVNLSGCVTARNLNVKEADENMVKNCQFVGTFAGSSAIESPLNIAINSAANKGATHYVLMDASSAQHKGSLVIQSAVRIRGYKCATNDSTSENKKNDKVVNDNNATSNNKPLAHTDISQPLESQVGIIIKKNTNIRSESNDKSKIIYRVKIDEKAFMVGTSGNWYKIKLSSGLTGWVSKNLVRELK